MTILQNLLNLFLQINCPLCQRPTPQEICRYCLQQLQTYQQQNPSSFWQKSFPVFPWGIYGGCLKRAIAVTKYENQPQIASIFGEWLGRSWLWDSPQFNSQPIVVPIPLHPSKLSQRGYNQARLIAQGFCRITGFKLQPQGLARVKATPAQYGLSPAEREKNLLNAFVVNQPLLKRLDIKVLLVDDIYTTGATANSARLALEQSGISVLGIAVVATTLKAGRSGSKS